LRATDIEEELALFKASHFIPNNFWGLFQLVSPDLDYIVNVTAEVSQHDGKFLPGTAA
jgi:hypothetical protein